MKHELLDRFSYHKASATSINAMEVVRQEVRRLAQVIDTHCFDGREKDEAFNYLQIVMMKANSSIVMKDPIAENPAKS